LEKTAEMYLGSQCPEESVQNQANTFIDAPPHFFLLFEHYPNNSRIKWIENTTNAPLLHHNNTLIVIQADMSILIYPAL
jgi:hypothetical protein